MDEELSGKREPEAIRKIDIIDIDCLSPENLRAEQDKDPILSQIKSWKNEGNRPQWSSVAPSNIELKTYWGHWEFLCI